MRRACVRACASGGLAWQGGSMRAGGRVGSRATAVKYVGPAGPGLAGLAIRRRCGGEDDSFAAGLCVCPHSRPCVGRGEGRGGMQAAAAAFMRERGGRLLRERRLVQAGPGAGPKGVMGPLGTLQAQPPPFPTPPPPRLLFPRTSPPRLRRGTDSDMSGHALPPLASARGGPRGRACGRMCGAGISMP